MDTIKKLETKMDYILQLIESHPEKNDVASLTMKIINEFVQLCIEYQRMINGIAQQRNAAIQAGLEQEKLIETLRSAATAIKLPEVH